jgi:predicted nucleic acid-binding protein
MIVVDANLVVYLHVAGQRTREAEAVLARDPTWAAPLLWRSEFRNVLAGLVRRKALAVEDAIRITGVAEEAMRGREYAVVSHEVLWLAARSGCSAYDCEYVALAQDLGVRLVTADRALLRAFPSVAVGPEAFVG